jgi:hypothetical protein
MAENTQHSSPRRNSITHADVLRTLDSVPGPVISSNDVASRYDVHAQTARNVLSEMVDIGRLASRKLSSQQTIYFEPDDGEETQEDNVTVFPTAKLVIAEDPSEATADTLATVGSLLDRQGDIRCYRVTRQTVDVGAHATGETLRTALRECLGADELSFISTIVDWWWEKARVAVYETEQSPYDDPAGLTFETVDDALCTDITRLFEDEWILAQPTSQRIVVDKAVSDRAVNRTLTTTAVTDNRPAESEPTATIRAITNGDVDGVPRRSLIIGVDTNGGVHVFDTLEEAVRIIDTADRSIEEYQRVATTGIPDWLDFIEAEDGYDWAETFVALDDK